MTPPRRVKSYFDDIIPKNLARINNLHDVCERTINKITGDHNMKLKVTLRYIILLIFGSYQAHAQGYSIKTIVQNQQDTVAFLGHHFATQRYVDDTAKVINGAATFMGDKALTEGIYFYYSPSVYFEFLIGEQNFSIEGEAPDVVATAKITGSPINIGFYDMQKFTTAKRNQTKQLETSIDSTATEAEKEAVANKIKVISREVKDYQLELQKKYPGSILDRLVRVKQTPTVPNVPKDADSLMFSYTYYKTHYWDGINIADPGLLRSPLLHNKIMDYLDNVVIQQADTIIIAVDELIADSKEHDEAFRYVLISLTNKYESSKVMGFDKVFVHLVDKYYMTNQATWTDAETIKKLEERAASIRPNFIGNPAPAFTLQDTLGRDYRLYDIDAKYTVLYFYDPDCGHCKKATPELYDAYADLQSKDVEVLAICTTTDSKRWHEFIVENDLEWINLADLASKTHIKYYYDVRSTPTVYILDENKKILLKKIATEDIADVIDQLIAGEKD
jgi:peroxiredoxin